MRDPERIDRILEKVAEYWKNEPDQRLGQLICNISRQVVENVDPFNLEDSKLEKFLDKHLSDSGKENYPR